MGWFTTSNRLTDTYGFIPPDNYGVALAKNLTYNHQPYTIVGDSNYGQTIEFNYHFIKSLRRVLSGVTGDTRMSKSEYKLYTLYIDWVSGAVTVTDPELFILTQLDLWLVDEIMGTTHKVMVRNYANESSMQTRTQRVGGNLWLEIY